jgi:hypothetical protein
MINAIQKQPKKNQSKIRTQDSGEVYDSDKEALIQRRVEDNWGRWHIQQIGDMESTDLILT